MARSLTVILTSCSDVLFAACEACPCPPLERLWRALAKAAEGELGADSGAGADRFSADDDDSTLSRRHAETAQLRLSALDAVPSAGDRTVRAARRALARVVEREAGRVEAWWRAVWDAHLAAEESGR